MVRDDRHCVLVLLDDLVELVVRDHVVLADFVAARNMVEKVLVFFTFSTSWTSKCQHLHNLANAIINTSRWLFTAAVLSGATP